MGNYPRISGWAWYHHKASYKRDPAEASARGESDVFMVAEIGIMHFEDRGRGDKPKNTSGNQKLERQGNQFPLELPKRMQPCWQPHEPDFRFLISRIQR